MPAARGSLNKSSTAAISCIHAADLGCDASNGGPGRPRRPPISRCGGGVGAKPWLRQKWRRDRIPSHRRRNGPRWPHRRGSYPKNVFMLLGTISAFADDCDPQIISATPKGRYDLSPPCETTLRDHQWAEIARRACGGNQTRAMFSRQKRCRPDIGPSLN
jgi:hypothetical protein